MYLKGNCVWRGFTFRADSGCGQAFGRLTGPCFHINLNHSLAVMELTEPVRIRGRRQLEFKLALAGHSIEGAFLGLFLQEVRGIIRVLAHPKARRLCL